MEVNRTFWRGKRVFLTGHTGFKGSWLALWLADMGADVHGYATAPPTEPSAFAVCDVRARLASHTLADVRDASALADALLRSEAEIVLHLAAQSLVRRSYDSPLETFAVNVMGTAHLLEAARSAPALRALVNVTTDKCYENREWVWPYRETEAMGGHDAYSASKGCAELLTAAYRASFLSKGQIAVATARAGNVIGGGDWATDRLLPDFLRALDRGAPLTIRSPSAVRPWQHVLEPLSGYMVLAEHLHAHGQPFAEGWNFGPEESDSRPVQWIVEKLCAQVPGSEYRIDERPQPHEANHLKLDSSKAKAKLGWRPRWKLDEALDRTLEWHRAWRSGGDMARLGIAQIHRYESASPIARADGAL